MRERLRASTEAALLDAAEAVFAVQGIHGARMDDVATEAGVAVGTLYNYFADRAALLEALMKHRRGDLIAQLDRALFDDDSGPRADFADRLDRFLRLLVAHLRAHWGFFVILFEQECPSAQVIQMSRRTGGEEIRARLRTLLEEGVRAGVVEADAVDMYPSALLGMLRGIMLHHARGSAQPPADDVVNLLRRLFLRGVTKVVP